MTRASEVWSLWRHELRCLIRDGRTVLLSLVLPLLLMPVLLLIQEESVEAREDAAAKREYRYSLETSQRQWLGEHIAHGMQAMSATEQPLVVEVGRGQPDDEQLALLMNKQVHVVVSREEGTESDDADETIVLRFLGSRAASSEGVDAIRSLLNAARQDIRVESLKARGLENRFEQAGTVETTDLASKTDSAGLGIGRLVTLFLVLMIASGGQVVSADLMAGEKERGTLETLLTTSVSRESVIFAKLLATLSVAFAIMAINIANLWVYVSMNWIQAGDLMNMDFSVGAILAIFILVLPVGAIVSSLLILVSGYAHSYKEVQIYYLPLLLGCLVPAMAPLMPGVELRSAIMIVPIANVAVCVRDIFAGQIDVAGIVGVTTANLLVLGGIVRWVSQSLHQEHVLFPNVFESDEAQGKEAALERHVLRWVALIWGFLFLGSMVLASTSLWVQVMFNLFFLMFCGSLFVIRRYKLDWREVFALRLPHRGVWLGVLIAAPGGMVCSHGIFVVASEFIPAPEALLKGFSEALLGGLPLWQMLIVIALVPAVFEELFFRGLLLFGLKRRLKPVSRCLAVGALFGVFHTSLFRLLPTGFLGIVFSAVTLSSRSIYPAMLWHFLNNGLLVILSSNDLVPQELPAWAFLVGVVALTVGMWLIWLFGQEREGEDEHARS